MTQFIDAEVVELQKLARDKTVAGRRALIATVSDLFFSRVHVLSDRERALMSDILRQIIHDVEVSVRKALAEKLAELSDIPTDLIRDLANDEIEVAHTILVGSEVLQDSDLIEIIQHRTLEHQLAIAMRRSVSEVVSDALVETGNTDVIRTLLENKSAQISESTLAYLIEQAKRHDSYHNPLLGRPELNAELAQRLYWWVSAALRRDILDRFQINATKLDESMENAVSGLVDSVGEMTQQESKAMLLADRLHQQKSITGKMLVETLRQGEIALFEAMFAKLTSMRLTLVRRMLFESGGEGLAIACKACDIDKSIYAAIFLLTRKARSTERFMAPSDVNRALSFFDQIKRDSADSMLKRWQRDPAFLQAIWQLDQPVSRSVRG